METKYIIETTDSSEANLMLNARKMALALSDLMDYKHAIYNSKEYEVSYLYNGELYTPSEFFKIKLEEGEVVKTVLTDTQVINKLDYILDGLEDLIYDYIE